MAIREDLITSAVQFLQDPSVSSSSVENRISFLRSKNLTQEEIDVALARSSGAPAPYPPPLSAPFYGQYPQHAWQLQPPPRRDWRDWFIMATVASGVSLGLYSLGKRYVYPLVAPPTPERLEQDKRSISDQFDKAFSLVEQLARDTEALKEAEKDRTERLDTSLAELDSVMSDLKAANRRREDDAQRIRDEVQALKDAIPKAMTNQKDLTDTRLREINTELSSLKTLISHRVSSAPAQQGSSTGYVRPSSEHAPAAGASSGEPKSDTEPAEAAQAQGSSPAFGSAPRAGGPPMKSSSRSGLNGGSAKASIPAWQLAMSSGANGEAAEGGAAEGDASA